MPYQDISADLTDIDKDEVLANIEASKLKLPFVVNLTMEERQTIPKMGDKTVSFVEKSLEYASNNPIFVPPYLNVPELQKDVVLTKQLLPIWQSSRQFFESVDDTCMALGSEAYIASLTFYNTVKQATKLNVPGADAIYQDLKERFPGTSGGDENPPE